MAAKKKTARKTAARKTAARKTAARKSSSTAASSSTGTPEAARADLKAAARALRKGFRAHSPSRARG